MFPCIISVKLCHKTVSVRNWARKSFELCFKTLHARKLRHVTSVVGDYQAEQEICSPRWKMKRKIHRLHQILTKNMHIVVYSQSHQYDAKIYAVVIVLRVLGVLVCLVFPVSTVLPIYLVDKILEIPENLIFLSFSSFGTFAIC